MDPIAERIAYLEQLNLIEKLLPAAKNASQLRGAGIRIAIDSPTRTALEAMAQNGNQEAAFILLNSFPSGHLEVALVK